MFYNTHHAPRHSKLNFLIYETFLFLLIIGIQTSASSTFCFCGGCRHPRFHLNSHWCPGFLSINHHPPPIDIRHFGANLLYCKTYLFQSRLPGRCFQADTATVNGVSVFTNMNLICITAVFSVAHSKMTSLFLIHLC